MTTRYPDALCRGVSLFATTILFEILLIGSLLISLRFPKHRIWPPPRKKSLQFWFTWILGILALFGIIILGILDWNSFIFNHWTHVPVGLILIAIGNGIALWGVKTLGVYTTIGLDGEFVTAGPYQYSRNPEYVGDIIAIFGLMLFSNSFLVLIAGTVGMIWYIIAPFSEEPVLKKRFKQYNHYCKKVRRFI